MPEPLATVIVPTRNRPELLASALQSILNQSMPEFEVVVVDDAGATPAVVPDDPRFRVMRLETCSGVANARNVGLEAATGELICFLDDDDLMTPVRLQIAVDHLADPVTVCAGGEIGLRTSSVRPLSGNVSGSILDTTTPHLGCVSVQRGVAPRFDTRFAACEDVDWLLRLAATQPFVSTERVGWLWRSHDGDRPELGADARLAGSRMLLDVHATYFRRHRRAASFRWFRVATYAQRTGRRTLALQAAARSAALSPHPRTLLRSWRVVVASLARSTPDGR